MDTNYNIYFAGEVLEGHVPATVRTALAGLFKADDATMDKLFSGKLQLIKRDCDKATALKYKQAMEQAGARPLIKASTESAGEKPMTAAEKIAALAAAPDKDAYRSDRADPSSDTVDTLPSDDESVSLSPPGTEVLRPDERPQPVSAEIDTSGLSVDKTARRLSEEPPPPPPAPDTSHLAMGEVGEAIPGLDAGAPAAVPDTSALVLAPEGSDFSDCTPPVPRAPDVDLSGMDLAPEGSDVLEEQYRKRGAADIPDTDHISLED